MYECLICDRRFHEFDVQTDEFGNKKAVCPYCKGDIEDLYECKVCGEMFTDDELTSGVCDGCIYEDVTFDRCLRYGADCEENIAINGFIASVLDAETINRILAEEIRKYILETISENGGHLASNLGVVELTIALHSVFINFVNVNATTSYLRVVKTRVARNF